MNKNLIISHYNYIRVENKLNLFLLNLTKYLKQKHNSTKIY
jgi:hypothetical protein